MKRQPDKQFLEGRGFRLEFDIGGVEKWSTGYSEGRPWFELYLNDKNSHGNRRDSIRSYGGERYVTIECSRLTRQMINEAMSLVTL